MRKGYGFSKPGNAWMEVSVEESCVLSLIGDLLEAPAAVQFLAEGSGRKRSVGVLNDRTSDEMPFPRSGSSRGSSGGAGTCLAFALFLLFSGVGIVPSRSDQTTPPAKDAGQKLTKKRVAEIGSRLEEGIFYLKVPSLPLLVNDEVRVVKIAIDRKQWTRDTFLPTRLPIFNLRLSLKAEGRRGLPEAQVETREFETEADCDAAVAEVLSLTPLEDAFDWPPEVKAAVRARFIGLGMNKDMVHLVLGGFPSQVDMEKLDDGRIREIWKLQLTPDTRRVFTQRSSTATGSTSGQVLTQPFGRGVISNITGTSIAKVVSSGWYVFDGLPPQFLHIVFTDGEVTARLTEFVK